MSIQNSPYYRLMWFILSFFLGIFAIATILLFFIFFGCSYEFVKCYFDKNKNEDENYNEEFNIQTEVVPEKQEPKSGYVIFLLIVCGIICQPLYLLFYRQKYREI